MGEQGMGRESGMGWIPAAEPCAKILSSPSQVPFFSSDIYQQMAGVGPRRPKGNQTAYWE